MMMMDQQNDSDHSDAIRISLGSLCPKVSLCYNISTETKGNKNKKVMDYDEEDLSGFEPEPDFDDLETSGGGIDPRVELSKQILRQVHDTIGNIIQLLEGGSVEEGRYQLSNLVTSKQSLNKALNASGSQKIIEGVFDGQNMVGSDGKTYAVPANYASKSLLVEGDILKLVVKEDGAYVFKQIGPIERRREAGKLAYDAATSGFVVLGEDDQQWKVITASVTFFKGEPGDEAIILVPKSTPSTWAAVENVVKK